MGMTKGPKPAPNVVRLAVGMEPRRNAADLGEVHPEVDVPPMPDFLTPEAAAEWARIVPELVELRLISRLDLAALTTYVCTFGRLVVIEAALQRLQAERVAAGADAADALVNVTPSGFRREDVLVRMAQDLTQLCDRLIGNFGLSPSTRARVRASINTGQLELPGLADSSRFFK